jgi:predicted ATP-dependent serine protease
MSRAGVGKTAFLVGIGLDSLLSGQRVLHVSRDRAVNKVRDRYDEILHELVKTEPAVENLASLQLDIERRRHVHTFLGDTFSVQRMENAIHLLMTHTEFKPDVLIVDRMDIASLKVSEIEEIRSLARNLDAEAWLSCRTHRDDPPAREGHLPPPVDEVEHLVDLVLRLDPHNDQVRLHALKDRDRMLDEDMHIGLDPHSLLLVPMHRSSLS